MADLVRTNLLNKAAQYLNYPNGKPIDSADFLDLASLFVCAGMAERYQSQESPARLVEELSPALFSSTTDVDVSAYLRDMVANNLAQLACAVGVFPFEKSLLNSDYAQVVKQRVTEKLKSVLSARTVQYERAFPAGVAMSTDLGFNSTLPQSACNRLLNSMLSSQATPGNPFDEQWQFASANSTLPAWVSGAAAKLPPTQSGAPGVVQIDAFPRVQVFHAQATRNSGSFVSFCMLLRALCFALHVQQLKSALPRGIPIQRVLDWGVLNTTADTRVLLVLCEATSPIDRAAKLPATAVALALAYLAELMHATELALGGVFDFRSDVEFVANTGATSVQVSLTQRLSHIEPLVVALPLFPVLKLSAFYECCWKHKVYESFSATNGSSVLQALARGISDTNDATLLELSAFNSLKLRSDLWFPSQLHYGSSKEQQTAMLATAREILQPEAQLAQSLTSSTAAQFVVAFDDCDGIARSTAHVFMAANIDSCPVSALISGALLPQKCDNHQMASIVVDSAFARRKAEHARQLSAFSANIGVEYNKLQQQQRSPRSNGAPPMGFAIDPVKFDACLDLIGRGARVDADHTVKCLANTLTRNRRDSLQPGTVESDRRTAAAMLNEAFSAFQ